MSKKDPILRRSDLNEMFDRSKLFLYDLLAIASDKDCDITIRIKHDNVLSFELMEECEGRNCYKKHYQTDGFVTYEETTIKKDEE